MSIVLYTTSSCPYCTMTKNYLQSQGLSYTEYNVERDLRRAEEMVRKSGQMGVPVLDVNGRILVGFRPNDIQAALKR